MASVNLPLHHNVQKFSSGTDCGVVVVVMLILLISVLLQQFMCTYSVMKSQTSVFASGFSLAGLVAEGGEKNAYVY